MKKESKKHFRLFRPLSIAAMPVSAALFLLLRGESGLPTDTPLSHAYAVAAAFAALLCVSVYLWLRERFTKKSVDEMSGTEFEEYCMKILRKNGFYNIEGTSTSGDFGVDILAEKKRKLYAVQCKRYSHSVGNSAVQQVFSGKDFYEADYAAVMTNNSFTRAAIETANKNGVILWDGECLDRMSHGKI